MPDQGKVNRKIPLPESEEHLKELELFKRICRNEASLETKKKEAREPLYLVRYE